MRAKMPRLKQPLASKHWCFTINNPEEEPDIWRPLAMTYLVLGLEKAPNTGTPHIQGYVVFNARKRRTAVAKFLPTAHLERMMGTPKQAAVYCKKDGVWTEFGVIPNTPQQGAQLNLQQRWDDAYQAAKENDFTRIPKSMLTRYYHAYKRIAQDNPVIPDDLDQKDNYWITAPTGFGKSTYARKKWPDFYDKAPNKWFVGYKDQSSVLCDDFGPDQCKYIAWYLKRWADKFAFPMETKGGGRMIRPNHIIVTSQYTIEECFEDGLVVDAINNRFNVINLTSWQQRERERIEQLSIDEELEAHGANDPTEDTISYHSEEEESVDEWLESIDLT